MRKVELTRSANPATKSVMGIHGFQFRLRRLLVLPLMGALALGGCISVKAPEKPIVIELNINIKQEVVYRLAQDANNTIESNPDIF